MAPEELHSLEYARHLLENELGWPPVKANLELLADCVSVVSKARKITKAGACDWLEAQIGKARRRGIKVNRWWLQEGEYNNLDDEQVFKPTFQKIDPVKTKQEQESAEWAASSEKARTLLAQIADGSLSSRRQSESQQKREKLKQQAAQLMTKRSSTESCETRPSETKEAEQESVGQEKS